jgi:neutral ceramidase
VNSSFEDYYNRLKYTMRKLFRILGVILLGLLALLLIGTSRVDHTPYWDAGYFTEAVVRIDSLKNGLAATRGPVEAGFAKVSISPGLNYPADDIEKGHFIRVPLAGYGARKGEPATGIHDSIFVKAVALKSNETLVVFVTADMLIMPPNITEAVMVRLNESGLVREQIFFSATHTHSGPGAWGPGLIGSAFAGKNNPNIEKWLVNQISEAILTAVANLKPARIGSGQFDAGMFTRNRLTGELGTKNDRFSFVVAEQMEAEKAILGCFSAHSTTLGAKNMNFSADYPGFWARKTNELTSGMALFFAGSMGSQSPTGEGNDFERARHIGEALADSTAAYYPGVLMSDSIIIAPMSLKIGLPEYHIRLTPRRGLSTFLSRKLMPYPGSVFLQVVRINNLVWITTPADFSGELALQIQNSLAAKGFDSMITGFNGSYVGYIIPGKYFYMDKYEPKTMGWFGPYLGDYTMDLIRQMYSVVINL